MIYILIFLFTNETYIILYISEVWNLELNPVYTVYIRFLTKQLDT